MSVTFFYNHLSFYVLCLFVLALLIQLGIHWIRFSRLAFSKRRPEAKADEALEPVSVVVYARDAYEHLVELIPTLLSQDYPKFEVVVVNDCSDDDTEEYLKDLERSDTRVKPVQLRQHLNFFNGKKFPLSMGIKSASYDLMVLTDANCRPASSQWLRSVACCYGKGTEMVLGYAPYANTGGLKNTLIRFATMQEGLHYLSAALVRKPYMGVGRNLSYRKRLFFAHKGFTAHYTMAAGDDDLIVSQAATRKNTEVQLDPANGIVSTPPSSFATWYRRQRQRYGTIGLHRAGTRAFMALHYWSQFLFYAAFIALFFLSPAYAVNLSWPYEAYYFPVLVLLFLLRYLSQLLIYRGASRRLGERGLLPGLLLWDFLFAVLTPVMRISGRMHK